MALAIRIYLLLGAWALLFVTAGCTQTEPFIRSEATPGNESPAVSRENKEGRSTETAGQPHARVSLTDSDGPIFLDSPYWPQAAPGQAINSPAGKEAPHCPPADERPDGPSVWGIFGFRGFPTGEHIASNGVVFKQLFSLDLDFNIWLCRSEHVYLFTDTRFWGQKPGPGITNPSQGSFDFSKREFDLDIGVAWNYVRNWEGRVFGYSFNNLNRGMSQTRPTGFNDGIGLENRYYFGPYYAQLGTAEFDLARATFVSLGYFPTKNMVDGIGKEYSPGAAVRVYATLPIKGDWSYLYADTQFIATRSVRPKTLLLDTGVAVRPFQKAPRLEFRVGLEDDGDFQYREWDVSLYGAVRFIY
jgi:hypothetical protein